MKTIAKRIRTVRSVLKKTTHPGKRARLERKLAYLEGAVKIVGPAWRFKAGPKIQGAGGW